jgi:hypothetical protein
VADAVVTVQESCFEGVCKIKFTWTSATDGSGSLASAFSYYGEVLALVTDPGATAPTDNYDLTFPDVEGYDVMQGAGANRDTANTETAVPTTRSPVFGKVTFTLANGGDAKQGVAILYILGRRL